jgi:hypothetical protein
VAKHVQTIVSTLDTTAKTGYAAILSPDGLIEFWIGTGITVDVISTGFRPGLKRWTELSFTIAGNSLSYRICPRPRFADVAQPSSTGTASLSQRVDLSTPCVLLFAASFAKSPNDASIHPTNFFNGRLDNPTMKSASHGGFVLAKWDFSLRISSDTIVDVSGNGIGAEGRLVNAPIRAVTGHDWDGMESDWTKAKYGYGAIHFHDDDLDDAAWRTDFSVNLPENVRSGVYAIEIEAINGKARDTIPFYVRPSSATNKALGAKVAYIISTFTASILIQSDIVCC